MRSAAATNMEFEWAPPMARILAMTGRVFGCSGMGTQLVGTHRMSAPCNAASRKVSGNQMS